MLERIRPIVERIQTSLGRMWTGHRKAVVAVSAVAVVAILASGVLIAVGSGGTAQATATAAPSAGATLTPAASPSASNSAMALPSPSDTAAGSAIPSSSWVASDLDGVLAPPADAHREPLAVMISDNAVDRPQSGISSASIVYQAPMEGGEDRYMFVFQEGTATDIGGVRSARPFFVYWVAEYKAVYAHVGGDPKVLNQVIPAMAANIYNVATTCPYHRISTRSAPHNDYTNTAILISCAAGLNFPSTYQNLPTRTFRDDTPAAELPASQVVSIPYHTGTVGYQFDPTTDSYLRIIGGKPEIDPANSKQVYARNVVVLFQTVSLDPQTDPGYSRILLGNVGSGKATLFIEGKTISATWKKPSNTALTRFYDSAGNEISLVRGESFMQVVPTGTTVTAK